MVLQIFGIPLSVSLRRSLVALKELDVPYALVTVDVTKGEQKSEETLKHQPFGQIPYIHDSENDLTLFESRAIARYVVNKYDKEGKSGLLPKDEVANAKFEQAASIEVTKFDPVVSAIATELVFKPVYVSSSLTVLLVTFSQRLSDLGSGRLKVIKLLLTSTSKASTRSLMSMKASLQSKNILPGM